MIRKLLFYFFVCYRRNKVKRISKDRKPRCKSCGRLQIRYKQPDSDIRVWLFKNQKLLDER